MDAGEEEPPPEGFDGEAPDWQPAVARDAEAEPPAAVEAVEHVTAGP